MKQLACQLVIPSNSGAGIVKRFNLIGVYGSIYAGWRKSSRVLREGKRWHELELSSC